MARFFMILYKPLADLANLAVKFSLTANLDYIELGDWRKSSAFGKVNPVL
ncbi:hypothetical protein BH20ACI4_BH20ACI4_28980 [soil metagenome]